MHALSLATIAAPVLDSRNRVWFRGHEITIIPHDYRISKWPSGEAASGPGGLRENVLAIFSLPTSQDGTRFLLHDKEHFPVLVDISGVISDRTTGVANRQF